MADNLQTLLRVRMRGARPASGCVDVWFGDFTALKSDWLQSGDVTAQVDLPADCAVDLLDLRCFVGLGVSLFVREWSDKAGRLVERIKSASPWFLQVLIGDGSGQLIGFAWTARRGDMTLDELVQGGLAA